MHLFGHWIDLTEPLHDDVLRGISLCIFVVREHLAARIEQEQAEQAQHPLKPLDHRRTGKNKDAAEDQCSKNAPKEHLVLILPLDAKEREQHEEHEQVVHRQRLLYQVARQKLHRLFVRFHRIE